MVSRPTLPQQLVALCSALLLLGQRAQAQESCTSTLADADLDGDDRLSLTEFTGFLQAEAGKNEHSAGAGAILTSSNDDITAFYQTFASTVFGGIDISGAKETTADGSNLRAATTTNITMMGDGQDALLELICARSKEFLGTVVSANKASSGVSAIQDASSPFKAELMASNNNENDKQFEGAGDILDGLDVDFEDPLGDLDIFGDFPLSVFGSSLNSATLRSLCPIEWTAALGCGAISCGVGADIAGACSQSNAVSNEMEGETALAASAVPACDNYASGVCDALVFPEECCLTDCTPDLYFLLDCAVQKTADVDRSECSYEDSCADVSSESPIDTIGGLGDVFGSTGEFNLAVFLEEYYSLTFGSKVDGPVVCPQEWDMVTRCALSECSFPFAGCSGVNAQGAFLEQSTPITTCEQHSDNFCEYFDIPDDCCMTSCEYSLFVLATCAINQTSAESVDLTACELPGCVGPAQFNETILTNEEFLEAIEAFQIDILGMTFNSETVPLDNECAIEFNTAASCVVDSCSNYREVCPEMVPRGNSSSILANGTSMIEGPSNCTEFADAYCGAFDEYPSECCLSSCIFFLHELSTCAFNSIQGSDFSSRTCFEPTCVADFWSGGEDPYGDGDTDDSFPNLNDFSFDYFGTELNAVSAQAACPDPWINTISCVVTLCPDFFDVCPIFNDILGESTDFNVRRMSNTTNANTTIPTGGCSELTEGFCDAFVFPEGCCLSDCATEVYELASCITEPVFAEEESNCEVPSCAETLGSTNATTVQTLSPILVNSSFLLSSLKGQTAEELREKLKAGQLEELQEAYHSFVQSVVDSFLGAGASSARKLLHKSWKLMSSSVAGRRLGKAFSPIFASHDRRQLEKMSPQLDQESAEIYDFVDSPCLENVIDGDPAAEVSRQSETTTCTTALGFYRVLADPEGDVNEVYESFVEATQSSITEGKLEEMLKEVVVAKNGTATFVVEGVSNYVDSSFAPFSEIVTSDADKESAALNSTTAAPASMPTAAPNSTQTPTSGTSATASIIFAVSAALVIFVVLQ